MKRRAVYSLEWRRGLRCDSSCNHPVVETHQLLTIMRYSRGTLNGTIVEGCFRLGLEGHQMRDIFTNFRGDLEACSTRHTIDVLRPLDWRELEPVKNDHHLLADR
jgi:hypothetical protein